MKKPYLNTLIVFLLAFLISLTIPAIGVVWANFIATSPSYDPPAIDILSPLNQSYNQDLLLHFNITLRYPRSQDFLTVSYSIDNQDPIICGNSSAYYSNFNWSTIHRNLTEGMHNLQVFVKIKTSYLPSNRGTVQTRTFTRSSEMMNFNVLIPPKISILSLENKTYHSTSIPLDFTVDSTTSWMGYSLDNQANTTLTGNTTLNAQDVKAGMHSLTLYANDTAGNMGKSKTIEFTFQPNIPPPTDTPTSTPIKQPTSEHCETPGTSVQPQAVLAENDGNYFWIFLVIAITCVSLLFAVRLYFKKKRTLPDRFSS